MTHMVIQEVGLAGISPGAAQAGSPDLELTVIGSNFTPDSVVLWNGAILPTNFDGTTQLTALVVAGRLESVQTAQISVYDDLTVSISPVLAFFVTKADTEVTGQAAGIGENPAATYGAATATATGGGLVIVAEYTANPGGTPSFTASGAYFDVYTAQGSTFSQVAIAACGLYATDKLFWWDVAANKWSKANPQSYDATSGCVTLVVTAGSSPSLSQLAGTYFVGGVESEGNTPPVAVPGGP
jgi:hypothetical protein